MRIKKGIFNKLLYGDLAKKHDTGGIFYVEDLIKDQKRFDKKEISFTAPMFGYKMREAKYESSIFEDKILKSVTINKEDFKKNSVKGTRRMGRILANIALVEKSEGLELSFMLPKGSYATTVLREFLKDD